MPYNLLFRNFSFTDFQLLLESGTSLIGNSSAAYANLSIIYFKAIIHIPSRKMLKRVGERMHHCLTPTVVLNHSPVMSFI